VSLQQRDALDRLLRDAPLDLGGDVAEQRVIFEEMMAAIPVPADVTTLAMTAPAFLPRRNMALLRPSSWTSVRRLASAWSWVDRSMLAAYDRSR
jgi:hypothetical protein